MGRHWSKIAATFAFVATLSLVSTAAEALPNFTSGSFAMTVFITSSNKLAHQSPFSFLQNLSTGAAIHTGGNLGSFAPLADHAPSPIANPAQLQFGTPSSFNFSQPATIGTFTATSVTLAQVIFLGTSVSMTWNVVGSLLLGADWNNHGTVIPASETWTFTQTGGASMSISAQGTFFAKARKIPEPLTLSLFGAGLIGAAALRRRRKSVKV